MSLKDSIGPIKDVMGGWYEPPYQAPQISEAGLSPTDFHPDVVGYSGKFMLKHANLRWNAMLNGQNVWDPFAEGEASIPFEIRPSMFLRWAQKKTPKKPEPTVSAFADWVYSLYCTSVKDPVALEFGLKIERSIFQERSNLIRERSFAEIYTSDWELIQNGLGYSSIEGNPLFHVYDIPDLLIEGSPVRGSPDLIYRNRRDGRAVIVEIKFTRKPLPSNLWPNVWAQLWAYSKIPTLKGCPSLTVVGEVWGDNTGRSCIETLWFDLYLRRSVIRDPRLISFEKFFNTLFRIYRGDYAEK